MKILASSSTVVMGEYFAKVWIRRRTKYKNRFTSWGVAGEAVDVLKTINHSRLNFLFSSFYATLYYWYQKIINLSNQFWYSTVVSVAELKKKVNFDFQKFKFNIDRYCLSPVLLLSNHLNYVWFSHILTPSNSCVLVALLGCFTWND